MDYIRFLLLGVGAGGVYAALALSLVVTFRASGVLNFAIGAVALYTSYTYALLRGEGGLLNPLPGFSTTIDLGGDPGMALSIVLSLAVAALLGLLLYVLVFRPLRAAGPVTKAVVSIGVLVTVSALLAQRVGSQPLSVGQILPTGLLSVGDGNVPTQSLWFAGTIAAIAVVLGAMFRFTRFGLASRGVAESERGAYVSGLDPDRIAATNWALSTAVAGLAGILISPIVVLVPDQFTLFVVPALAAALVAGFSSLTVTIAAGLLIGMMQSELTFLETKWTWLPQAGMPELVPLALVIVYLVVRGRPLPERGAIVRQTLGRAPRPRHIGPSAVAAVLAGIALLLITGDTYRDPVDGAMGYAMIALGLVVVTGYCGQISLAQLTLGGAGAFMLSTLTQHLGVPFPIAPLLAAGFAAVIGVIVGLPALRVRGLPLAVVTLALAVFLNAFWFNDPSLNTGTNTPAVDPPSLFGINLSGGVTATPRIQFGLTCLVLLVLAGIGVAALRRSRLGGAMLAVRANERSAAAAGINLTATKLIAFAAGSFLAGLGGALLAYQQGNAAGTLFDPITGLAFFAIVYLAGITSVSGAIIAGLMAPGGPVYIFLNDTLSLGDWYSTLSGLGLVLTVIMNPEGVARIFHLLADRWDQRRQAAPSEPSPATVDDSQLRAVEPPTLGGKPLLEVSDLRVAYGGVVAVDGVALSVHPGEIVGLIGPNGAGKTTLIDAVSGFAPNTGVVRFEDDRLDDLRPHQRVRKGLGRTFQGIELYEDLTVEENVGVGEEAARHGGDHLSGAVTLEKLFALLGLEEFRHRTVGELSPGRRQLVSIARALAGRPRVVLLDEPAGGLDSSESRWLAERLRAVRAAGASILLVDHDMTLVLGLCDRVYVLDMGQVIAEGPPAEVLKDQRVATAYLGTTDHQLTEETS